MAGSAAQIAAALSLAALAAPPPAALAQDSGRSGQTQDVSAKRVTLNLENADIRFALKLLFQSAGANYTLDSAVQGTVTASLTDVPFRTALESLLRTAQSQTPLTYRIENGVYNVGLRREEVRENEGPGITDQGEEPKRTTKVARIQLNYADPADITAALGGTMLPSRLAQYSMGFGAGGFGGAGMMGGMGNRGNMGGMNGMNGMNGSGNGLGGNSGIGIINLNSNGFGSFGGPGGQNVGGRNGGNGGSGVGLIGNFGSGYSGGGRTPGR
jgi:hypothetical protein